MSSIAPDLSPVKSFLLVGAYRARLMHSRLAGCDMPQHGAIGSDSSPNDLEWLIVASIAPSNNAYR